MSARAYADAIYARLATHQRHVAVSQHILEHAAATLGDGRVAVAFSGGKDSLVSLHLARAQWGPRIPVLFAPSGADFPETLAYIERLERDWDLDLYLLPPDKTILELHRASGIWDWEQLTDARRYDYLRVLIREPMARAQAHLGLAGQVIGLRAQESAGRAALFRVRGAVHAIQHETFTHIHPLAAWSTADVWAYIAHHDLPYNPVYDRLAALGVARDDWRVSSWAGTTGHTHGGRFATLKAGWPDLYQQFADACPRIKEAT